MKGVGDGVPNKPENIEKIEENVENLKDATKEIRSEPKEKGLLRGPTLNKTSFEKME